MAKPPTPPPASTAPTVFVVDDDTDLRDAVGNLLQSVGLQVALFGSAAELLAANVQDAPGCIVLDIRLPGVSGLDFQGQLQRAGILLPIVFMTGHGDIQMTVRAMKAGAIDFLTKPFRDQDMLDAVAAAIEKDRTRRGQETSANSLKETFGTLTPRETEVMALVTKGLLNKQIAGEIGLAEITVKIHRGNVMRKMGAKSLPDLVRMAEALGLHKET